jgi:hypothetical protein
VAWEAAGRLCYIAVSFSLRQKLHLRQLHRRLWAKGCLLQRLLHRRQQVCRRLWDKVQRLGGWLQLCRRVWDKVHWLGGWLQLCRRLRYKAQRLGGWLLLCRRLRDKLHRLGGWLQLGCRLRNKLQLLLVGAWRGGGQEGSACVRRSRHACGRVRKECWLLRYRLWQLVLHGFWHARKLHLCRRFGDTGAP